ncbi:hypothetical protein NDU88_004115 [Pleurodeles waltl]|uniref:Uncharacterized protein n=1 Tax=Pleurodeles waltl TaxID=8319 RepID=A0AAV7PE34_PLEWA|nr:hypothetical protein NDU88_004115 [Pleurodeles waltl]
MTFHGASQSVAETARHRSCNQEGPNQNEAIRPPQKILNKCNLKQWVSPDARAQSISREAPSNQKRTSAKGLEAGSRITLLTGQLDTDLSITISEVTDYLEQDFPWSKSECG